MSTSPDGSPLPAALYSCAMCAEEHSFLPDDLFWVKELGGWYCVFCIDDMEEDDLTIVMTMDKWINQKENV